MPALTVEDRPRHAFRAMHVCWLPETEMRTIERQIRLAAYYKFNVVVLESWGVFKSERHPASSTQKSRSDTPSRLF